MREKKKEKYVQPWRLPGEAEVCVCVCGGEAQVFFIDFLTAFTTFSLKKALYFSAPRVVLSEKPENLLFGGHGVKCFTSYYSRIIGQASVNLFVCVCVMYTS